MSYLLNLQRAIYATKHGPIDKFPIDDYCEGWQDAEDDLAYADQCGETACKQHIKNWLDTTPSEWDANNQAYHDRIKAIQEYMQAQDKLALNETKGATNETV